jgi:hypothetical protein
VAQLGARLDGIEEAVGSNPIGSTNTILWPVFESTGDTSRSAHNLKNVGLSVAPRYDSSRCGAALGAGGFNANTVRRSSGMSAF